jgi:putative hydrolase of the HAD superfamily
VTPRPGTPGPGITRPSASGAEGWLVLDVDDTLVATYQTGLIKCQQVARTLGVEPPAEAAFAGLYGRLPFDECVRHLHPGIDLARYQASYDALAARFPPVPLCDGASLMTAASQAGLRCGVLTNGPAAKTTAKLRACGLDPAALDFVVCGDTSPVRKPDVRAFARLAAHGVAPGAAWYVSDSAAEWRAAELAGFLTAGVATGRAPSRGFLPMLLLPSTAALPALVPGLASLARPPGARRPGAPGAASFDAGFTLIEPLLTPADIILAQLDHARCARSRSSVQAALVAAEGILARPQTWWLTPASADQTLRSYYEAVLARLGCPDRTAAGTVLSRYACAANWRPVPGAHGLLAAGRASGRKTGVLSNWQPSLAGTLRSAGLARHLDVILPSTLARAAKPSGKAFGAVAAALGTTVQGLVHVGDSLDDDVLGALRAGGRAVLAQGPPSRLADCLGAA